MAKPDEQQLKFIIGVATAQLIALLAACSALELEHLGEDSRPMFIVSLCYGTLTLLHGSYMLYRQGCRLTVAWWKYALLAFNDVSAAYCVLLSLQYTTASSWSLLQTSGFLTVVPLSILLLNASYSWKHAFSGILTLGGLVLLLFSDAGGKNDDSDHSDLQVVGGDLLAVLGACLYGVNNVMVETITKGAAAPYEVLGMIGIFGFVYSFTASLLLGEISADMFEESSHAIYIFTAGFANFLFYALMIVVLANAGAAVLTLSLLGTNFWSVLGKLLIIGGFHTNVIGFVFAVLMVITGVTLFTLSGNPYAKKTEENAALLSEPSEKSDRDENNDPLTDPEAPMLGNKNDS